MTIKFKTNRSLQEESVKHNPTQRNIPKWQWYTLTFLLISPFIYFVFKLLADFLFLTIPGQIIFDKIIIRAPENSYVAKIFVQTGESVKNNQNLLQLFSPTLVKNIEEFKQEIIALEQLKKTNANQELESLLTMQKEADAHLKDSIIYLKKITDFYKRGLVSIIEVDRASDDVHESKIKLNDLKRRTQENHLKHALTLEKEFDEKIRKITSEIQKLENTQQRFLIKASKIATVINIDAVAGEFLTQGSAIMELATTQNFQIRAYLDPKYMSKVKYRQTVTIIYPDNLRVKGILVNMPRFATRSPSNSLLNPESDKIVLIIQPTIPPEPKYQVYGIPVKIII